MMGRITAYALRHRAIVLALLLLFIIAGVEAFLRLPVEAYPDVTNVSFQVITLFPGHAAEEVERLQFQAASFNTGKRQSKIGRPTKKERRDLDGFMGE